MARRRTTPSPGITVTLPANVPGVPTWVESTQFRITSSNDVLVLTSDQGGPVSIDVPDGVYTCPALAAALQDAMNADGTLTGSGTITFSVSYDDTASKFTIDAGSGHTIAFTYSGSDAAETFGFDGDKSASQTITSDSETHGTGTITFDFEANGNGDNVEYAIFSNTDGKYVGADGVPDEASEVWQTRADWNNGGQAGRVTVVGLTDYTSYTFKIKARNEAGDETDFCADSAAMNTKPNIDWGDPSDALTRRVTTGNTRIKENGVEVSSSVTKTVYINGTCKAIPVQFALENYDSTTSRVVMEFSEDDGNTWNPAHTFFDIYSGNKTLRFTSDQGGPVDISIAEATYDTGAALAAELQSKMNADGTLTGSGTITFSVSFNTSTGKYTIDAGAGHTIALDYYNSNGAYAFGFTDNKSASQTITSDESRGDPPNTLSTSQSGTSHTIYWDSGRDAGKSEHKTATKLRLTPYDSSPSGGDAAKAEVSDAFEVDNRPSRVTVQNYDGRAFDKDTTPVFSCVMGEINCGRYLFFEITIEDGNGQTVLRTSSAENVVGWEYETSPGNWSSVTPQGINIRYADGTNRVRYTCQAPLEADNTKDFTITFRQGETRDRG